MFVKYDSIEQIDEFIGDLEDLLNDVIEYSSKHLLKKFDNFLKK